jgi:hypothetical protein
MTSPRWNATEECRCCWTNLQRYIDRRAMWGRAEASKVPTSTISDTSFREPGRQSRIHREPFRQYEHGDAQSSPKYFCFAFITYQAIVMGVDPNNIRQCLTCILTTMSWTEDHGLPMQYEHRGGVNSMTLIWNLPTHYFQHNRYDPCCTYAIAQGCPKPSSFIFDTPVRFYHVPRNVDSLWRLEID